MTDDLNTYIFKFKHASTQEKNEWILSFTKNQKVLDLGIVDHDIQFYKKQSDTWLHGLIVSNSSYCLGIDILEKEIAELKIEGFNVVCSDASTLRLEQKFEVIVCGDLIEHVSNPGDLMDTIAYHLKDDGIALITTPHPFAVNRFFNVLIDGWTPINTEHVSWLCPQTIYQLAERYGLYVSDFSWLTTRFPMHTQKRIIGPIANGLGKLISTIRPALKTDFGVVLKKKTSNSSLLHP